jgi:thiaminase
MSKQVPIEVMYAYCDYIEDMMDTGQFLEIPSARDFCNIYLEEITAYIDARDGNKPPTPPTTPNPFGHIY